MKMRSKSWKQITRTINTVKGFSLVELLVALAVLSIILIPFLHLLIVNYTNIVAAGNKSQALFSVQNELENALDTSSVSGVSRPVAIVFPGIVPIHIGGRMITIYDNYHRGNNVESTELIVVVP